jgi:carboxymethylenebutenolidase
LHGRPDRLPHGRGRARSLGAGLSFHGGQLTTMNPDSPHLLIPKTKAQYLVAVAENDDMREPNSKTILKDAFAAAKIDAEVEVYKAAHGWCPPDTTVYNRDESERAWDRMLVMFKKALA